MNYIIPKPNKNQVLKAVKCLSVVSILFLLFSTFFYSKTSTGALPYCDSYSDSKSPGVNCVYKSCADSSVTNPTAGTNCLPNCGSLTAANSTNGSATPLPGVNCYYLDLPLCTATSTSVSVTNAGLTPQPRSNCADLIDLPLCSQMDSNALYLKNCINECDPVTDVSASAHGTSCVRFCDKMPTGMTANSGTNCVARKCYQLANGVLPTTSPASPNCTMSACNTLIPDELNELRIQDPSNGSYAQYCDGSKIKCYNFTLSQLPYVRWFGNSDLHSMCQMHSCKPVSSSCADDTLNITNKGKDYQNAYQANVYFGYDVTTNNSMCTPASCKPTYYVPYICSHDASDLTNPDSLTIKNSSCDSTGDGSICATTDCDPNSGNCLKGLGYCYQTVDCNLAANSSNSVCTTQGVTEQPVDTTIDDTESSFYRPKPLSKTYVNNDPNQGYRVSGDCYTEGDLKKQGWGDDVEINILGLKIPLGYFHYELAMVGSAQDKTRSPRYCNESNINRDYFGKYAYLCGNKGNISAKVSDHTAFIKGYTNTTFDDEGNSTSQITACLRFKNFWRPLDPKYSDSETCGRRECSISFLFGDYDRQHCGSDVCKTITVHSDNSKLCEMNNALFNDLTPDSTIDCLANIGPELRVRAVQYSNYVCAFLDSNGFTAYNRMFLDGSQTMTGVGSLKQGTICYSGSYNPATNKCDNAKDSNDKPSSISVWRAIMPIAYTQGDITLNGVSGFRMKNGKFIPAQQCAKVALPPSPPDLYNLANSSNSLKLFSPPLFIRSVNSTRGGNTVLANDGTSFGTTDFLFPEITVQFGTTIQKLSLGAGYDGSEASKDPNSIATIETVSNEVTYSATILIKKEINANNNQPMVCLYRRTAGIGGFNDIKIGCANRSYPEINNAGTVSASTIGVRKILIGSTTTGANTLSATGTYNDSSISLTYCGDSSCTNTNKLTLTNSDPNTPTCGGTSDSKNEAYRICVQRETCSKLYKECFENEIAIQNLGMNDSRNFNRSICQSLAVSCTAKNGITPDSNLSFLSQALTTSGADSNAYGWFNELCIVSGFESKLIPVYGKNTTSGVMGKCLIDTAKSSGSCSAGGNAALGCYCLDASSKILVDGYTIRTQTPREAGLCIDIPTPKTCSPISYGGDTYTQSSLGKSSYGTSYSDTTNVNPYHRDRANANSTGHAEFPIAIVGMNNVTGTCNGFWKNSVYNGVSTPPVMSCQDNSNSSSNGAWSGVSKNSCVRYSCPAITTGSINGMDANIDGSYSNLNYVLSTETTDAANNITKTGNDLFDTTFNQNTAGTQGSSNGYATWSQITKSTDFLESASAGSCITGFKQTGSALPTRACDQLGNWNTVNNSCQRITCPAINPPYLPTTTSDWQQWSNSGGATFGVTTYLINDTANNKYLGAPILYSSSGTEVFSTATGSAISYSTLASRSPTSASTPYATPGSTRKGYCNTRLGYFQAINSSQPEIDCKVDGTWSAVRNVCVTQCDAVSSDTPSLGHGNAKWPGANQSVGGDNQVTTASSCISNYYPYPYNKFKDDTGALLSQLPAVTNTSPGYPTRTCVSSTAAGGVTANYWSNPSSVCVNKCPGSDIDPRVGAGVTQHNTKNYGVINIQWPSTSPGQTATQTVGYDSNGVLRGVALATQYASDYNQTNKTSSLPNSSFIVVRTCGSDLRWQDTKIQCATNGGNLNNAILGTSNNTTGILYGASISGTTTPSLTCATNYGSPTLPTYQCVTNSLNTSNNIDQYYYNFTDGKECTKTCPLTKDQTLGSGSRYTGETPNGSIKYNGDSINLSCKDSSYGKASIAGSSAKIANNSNICGLENVYNSSLDKTFMPSQTTTRTAPMPTATCTDGSWKVSNDCTSCNTCNASSPTFYNFSPAQTNSCILVGTPCKIADIAFVINNTVNTSSVNCGDKNDETRNVKPANTSHYSCEYQTAAASKCSGTQISYHCFSCIDGSYYAVSSSNGFTCSLPNAPTCTQRKTTSNP